MAAQKNSINRIRLEFKGEKMLKEIYGGRGVLIESDWNLKCYAIMVRLSALRY